MDFTVKDVGAIPRDIPITVQVVITNNKPDSITITKTSTTCDCMDVQIPKNTRSPGYSTYGCDLQCKDSRPF